MKLVTTAQMRALEQRSEAEGVSTATLMENAGLAVAQEAWLLLTTLEDRRIVVLVGPGNNGGDGMVSARRLHEWGAQVEVYTVRRRGASDPNEAALVECSVPLTVAEDDPDRTTLDAMLQRAELVIDALLGTGVSRPIEGVIAELLDHLRAMLDRPIPPQVIAVDVPSGLNSDTGAVDPRTVPATTTAALGFAKVGAHMTPGAEFCGQENVLDIGLPKDSAAELPIELLDDKWVRNALPKRPSGANKGTFGKLFVVAGSRNYVGAPALCSLAAYRSGAGLVTIGSLPSLHPVLTAKVTEATFFPVPETETGSLSIDALQPILQALDGYDVLLIGPGLGTDPETRTVVRSLLTSLHQTDVRGAVVDADALNALAGDSNWWERVRAPIVLTPHPGEMGRLTSQTPNAVQVDRMQAAMHYGSVWGQVIALKGANSIVSDGNRALLSPFANAALAVAGTGDVLAGAIAGFMCQGIGPLEAAACGVYVHGLAGEIGRSRTGSAGLLASDLLPLLPEAMKQLRGERGGDSGEMHQPGMGGGLPWGSTLP